MPETFIKSNQTRSLGPKAMWPDDKTFWSIIFLITTKSNTFLSRKKKKEAMEWSQNHFEAYNSTDQTLFVYNITLTWHLDQGHLQFCVNFMYVYGIIWGGKNSQSFTCLFSPLKILTFIHIGLTLAKSSSREGFITYPTVTTLLPVACLQCKTYKKRFMTICNKRRYPNVYLLKKKVVIREW